MKPAFVLGVGAQKSATSWLREQLHQQSFANFGLMKEYHVWDTYFLKTCQIFNLRSSKRQQTSWSQKVEERNFESALAYMQSIEGIESRAYTNYFNNLINTATTMTGDFTPTYQLLQPRHYKFIKNQLVSAGFDVKVIFVMRDPVERIWSAIKMRQREEPDLNIQDEDLPKIFAESYNGWEANVRSRYDVTINNLREAFDESELHFEFFEQLFTPDAIGRLNTFLNVKLQNVQFDVPVNQSRPTDIDIPDVEALKCRKKLSNVYDFCYENFPITKSLWLPY